MMKYFLTLFSASFAYTVGVTVLALGAFQNAADAQHKPNKFEQLGTELPTPNVYRAASGAPGHLYWQQRADYNIRVELNDDEQRIYGEETIVYFNNSPDALTYLWVQLDQNLYAKNSDTYATATYQLSDKTRISASTLQPLYREFEGGFNIEFVKDAADKPLPFVINKTMMRVDLPQTLLPKAQFSFKIKWWYKINDGAKDGGRSGYEYFPADKNYVYSIAQFYPRMAVYDDVTGWQNKQFLGRGEFALTFGNYEVSITAPEDHIIAATGVLQNAENILTPTQRQRLNAAKTASTPMMIVTQQEATQAEKTKAKGKKTWSFKAENVRDFAFASSRKFIWDAMGVPFGDRVVMAMSFYPKEGNPLWEQYSTKAVAHTLRTYSKFTFDYPYPVAISTHASFTGMEYPMISFNFGRPEPDGTYSERIKYGMIGVVIHEVGHNYFPMIVNSDERQWTWMDEGLNSFLEYLTEQEWEKGYPSRRGPAPNIVEYMKGDKSNIRPIMTNSESIFQFGNNAYGKPATALNILRETVMGRELFDHAFKTYAQRWMFKHPSPADFFRTMEDASAVDLDWFWRGWFYTTDHVDIAIESVKWLQLSTNNPAVEKNIAKQNAAQQPVYISDTRNEEAFPQRLIDKDPSLKDFYNRYDPFEATALDVKEYEKYYNSLSDRDKKLLAGNDNFYEISFRNVGGLIMPIILAFEFTDGTKEVERIPAEIWRQSNEIVTKVFVKKKEVRSIVLDPFLETADVEVSNNYFPPRVEPTRFELFKSSTEQKENTMQRARRSDEIKNKKN